MKSYSINEIFYSIQGEGLRAGEASIFVRFSGCNEQCALETHGFDCDTEFVSGRKLDLDQIIQEIKECDSSCKWLVLTGGEPGLQVDSNLISALKNHGYKLAIETNGSIELPDGFDWITVSPKVAEHAIKQRFAHEVKYVRGHGQNIPKTVVQAQYKLISPSFIGEELDRKALNWCAKLVRENPEWRLSVQQHKIWRVR